MFEKTSFKKIWHSAIIKKKMVVSESSTDSAEPKKLKSKRIPVQGVSEGNQYNQCIAP